MHATVTVFVRFSHKGTLAKKMLICILSIFILSHRIDHHRENIKNEHTPKEVHGNKCVDDETNIQKI